MNAYLESYLRKQDYEAVTRDCIRWIRTWFDSNGPASPAVIGISGGKDSTVVAALCREALGKDRVFGVLMPNGVQPDISVSRHVVDYLDIAHTEINIRSAYDALRSSLCSALSCEELTPQSLINLPPRLRMTVLYAVSQNRNGRVSNNGNRSERYVGYCTLYGDAAGDFSPLAGLTVTEVRIIGRILGLPSEFIEKAPSDGLSGKTDEDALGFTYEQLDTYILTGFCDDEARKAEMDRRHASNLFKVSPMPMFLKEEKQ